MRSSNPALTKDTFAEHYNLATESKAMTVSGTVNKTFLMILLVVLPASFVWNQFFQGANVMPWMIGGAIGGFIVAMITVFKQAWAPVTAPLYALLEGVFLGAVSGFFEAKFPGIVIQAVALTFGTAFSLLAAYKSGLIKVTQNFRLGVVAATGGIALIYFVNIILGFLGINMPYIHESGLIGIGFSLFVVIIAALNLVLDFDFIEDGAEKQVPKYMEWYAAFGLVVTLIWLYIEFLRLLSKLRER